MAFFRSNKHNLSKVSEVFDKEGLEAAKKELINVMEDTSGLVFLISQLQLRTARYMSFLEQALEEEKPGIGGGGEESGFYDCVAEAYIELSEIVEIIEKILKIIGPELEG